MNTLVSGQSKAAIQCYEEGKQVGLQLCNFLVALIVGAVVADVVLIQLIFTVSVSKCSWYTIS